MPIKITLYGPETSGMSWLDNHIREVLNGAGLPYVIERLSDVDSIIASGVESVPAVSIEREDPIRLSACKSFGDFTQKVLHALLAARNYGKLAQLVLPILPDFDFRPGMLYSYKLAADINAVVRVETLPGADIDDDVLLAIDTIVAGAADVAFDSALIYCSSSPADKPTDLVIWSYGTPPPEALRTYPILYIPPGHQYEPIDVVCYHEGTVLPDIVIKLWPNISLCDEQHEFDLVVTQNTSSYVLDRHTLLL